MTAAETFRDAVGASAGVAHGPLSASEATVTVCERVAELADGGDVAVSDGDPLVRDLGIVSALESAGITLVLPDQADWREAVAQCAVGVTGSVAAAAETGTVALGFRPGSPRAVSLLPGAHICLVAASSVEDRFEEAFTRAVASGLPAGLVWVTGPSRTADIEKRIVLGMHGPQTFEAVIVSDL